MNEPKEKSKAEVSRVAGKPSSLVEKIKSPPVKKITAIVGLIGLFIGVIAGGFGLVKDYLATKEENRIIAMHIEVGDRFVEQYKLNEGIAEFEKALEKDTDNIAAHRRIISAMRVKYEVRDEPIPPVEDVQTRIYQLQALHPELKDDLQLSIDEARVIRYNNEPHSDPFNRALQIMAKMYELYPDNPEVLAQLGLLRALDSPRSEVSGIDFLKKAIDIVPDESRYHRYLARAFARAYDYNGAINEYYEALKNLRDKNFVTRSERKSILGKLYNLLRAVFLVEGPLTSKLELPIKERAEIFGWSSPSSPRDRWYLADLYYSLGDNPKADSVLQINLGNWYREDADDSDLLYWYYTFPNTYEGYFATNSMYNEWLIRQEVVALHIKIM